MDAGCQSYFSLAQAHARAAGGERGLKRRLERWAVWRGGGWAAGVSGLRIRTRRAGSLFDLKRGVRAARRVGTAWPNLKRTALARYNVTACETYSFEAYCFGPLQRTAYETYSFQNLQLCNMQLCSIQPLKPTAFKKHTPSTTYNLHCNLKTYSFATTQMQHAALAAYSSYYRFWINCSCNPNCSCNRALATYWLSTALAYNTMALTATLA